MAATDDSFRHILGRAKMREKAMRSALDAQSKGALPEITPELIQIFEEDFYRQVFDGNGDIIDEATKFAAKEVTLTQDLTGFSKGLNDVFTANPWAKPFFLFARTGINGLTLTAKHTPGFNFLVKEFNEIAFADPNNLASVAKYGITNASELANAQALQVGRLAMGSSLVSLAIWSWMNGTMTGNGPVDRQTRQMWLDTGWQPRSIKIGDVWVGYDSIEPFNQMWSVIADIGDSSMLMGEEWTEGHLQRMALLTAQGLASKSYLQGMQMWVDAFAGSPGSWGRVGSSLINNTVPLAALRNEMGKIFTPHTRELSSSIFDAVRNRNLLTEKLTSQPLTVKYDILGKGPLRDHDFITRVAKGFFPVNFELEESPGRRLLWNSGYDLRLSVNTAPDGTSLAKHPRIRSLLQEAIGNQNLEDKLNRLAKDPKIIESVELMYADRASGRRGDFEPRDYYHNQVIKAMFDEAKRIAWISISDNSAVQELQAEDATQKLGRSLKQMETAKASDILSIYK